MDPKFDFHEGHNPPPFQEQVWLGQRPRQGKANMAAVANTAELVIEIKY